MSSLVIAAHGTRLPEGQQACRALIDRVKTLLPGVTVYDAYVELDLSSWDAMAGLLLIEEAGGYVGAFPGPGGLTVRAPVVGCAAGLVTSLRALLKDGAGI